MESAKWWSHRTKTSSVETEVIGGWGLTRIADTSTEHGKIDEQVVMVALGGAICRICGTSCRLYSIIAFIVCQNWRVDGCGVAKKRKENEIFQASRHEIGFACLVQCSICLFCAPRRSSDEGLACLFVGGNDV